MFTCNIVYISIVSLFFIYICSWYKSKLYVQDCVHCKCVEPVQVFLCVVLCSVSCSLSFILLYLVLCSLLYRILCLYSFAGAYICLQVYMRMCVSCAYVCAYVCAGVRLRSVELNPIPPYMVTYAGIG